MSVELHAAAALSQDEENHARTKENVWPIQELLCRKEEASSTKYLVF
jgi:hypothetical protein